MGNFTQNPSNTTVHTVTVVHYVGEKVLSSDPMSEVQNLLQVT